jgi:hypothetical protein
MLLRADSGNYYSQMKVTLEGSLNAIVNKINKKKTAESGTLKQVLWLFVISK